MSLQQLACVRKQISDITAKIQEIESASLTKQDVEERVKAFVQNLQHRFDADYIGRGLVSAGAGITTTDILAACSIDEQSTADRPVILAAWLHPELLERKLMDAAAHYVAAKGIPSDKRPSMLKKLDGELSELLHLEEQLIVELTNAGHEVFRRANIDPLVILAATE